MAASFRPFDHDGIGARSDQTPGQNQRRGEANQFRPILHRFNGRARRNSASQHDMTDLGSQANADKVIEHRVHRDQVHAEWFVRHRLRSGDFRRQQIRRHGAARDHPKPAGIGNGGDQMTLTHPAHGSAKDGDRATEKFGATGPQPVEACPMRGVKVGHGVIRHRGHKRYAAPARPVRYTPPISGR